MPQGRKMTAPVVGAGILYSPHRPKYSQDNGVTGYANTEYHDDDTVTAIYLGDRAVLALIAAEADVVDHGEVWFEATL